MNRFLKSPRFFVAATLATAALAGASVAEARPDVYFSIGFQGIPTYVEPPPVYLQPQPIYLTPRPIYVQPAPTFARPPVFVAPREVFERRREWAGDAGDRRDEWERERASRRDEWRRRQWREHSNDRYNDREGRKWHHDYRD